MKMIFTDIDGTIRDTPNPVSKETINDIKSVIDQGIKFTLATGNIPFDGIKKIGDMLESEYIIGGNGSAIWDVKNEKYIHKEFIDILKVIQLRDLGHKLNERIDFFNTESAFVNITTGNSQEMITRYVGKGVIFKDYFDIDEEIIKCEYYCKAENLDVMIKLCDELELGYVVIEDKGLEIMSRNGINKLFGIKKIMSLLNIQKENIMTIGDGKNDIEMLEFADESYWMASGVKSVEQYANFKTGHVADNGAGEAFIKFAKK